MKKIEETLLLYKQHKKFLDVVAISAQKKSAKNKLKLGSGSSGSGKGISPEKRESRVTGI